MVKKSKIQTPEWVLKGFDSEKEYLAKTGKKKQSSSKVYKIKKCPKCKSTEIKVVLTGKEVGEEEDNYEDSESSGKGEWECKKCKWRGKNILEEEVSEDEFLDYLESQEGVDKE
jgi:hypothetical protein